MRTQRLIHWGIVLLGIAGCGSRFPPGADPDRARSQLMMALDAWKSGQVATLATQSPPIRFQDDDFMAGWQLIGYELADPAHTIMPFHDVKVVLDLRDSQGRPVRKAARYQIGLEPFITVQRSDN